MPDDLRVQVDLLHACVKGMGYPLLCVEGVEADDVIGTLARSSAAADRPVIISTGDKDMAQLVDGHITLVNTMTGSVLDVAGVKEKFGVGPEHIIDYLALMGDKVDNIPGVPGVGEKTAVGLLVGVGGGIKELYERLETVATLPIRGAKTLAAKLEEHRAMAFLSYELATIKIDVPLDIELDQLHCGEPDRDKLMELYAELEFKSWIEDLQRDAKRAGQELAVEEPTVEAKEAAYEVILEQSQFDAWLKKLNAAPLFAFVTQSNGTDAQRAQLVGLSFAIQTHEAAYIPLTHSYMGCRSNWTATRCSRRSSRCLKTRIKPRSVNTPSSLSTCLPTARSTAIRPKASTCRASGSTLFWSPTFWIPLPPATTATAWWRST